MQNLKVIYEDNHIIVVEKTPNIPSQSDKTGDIDMLTLVKQYIKEKYNKPGNVYLGLVHRLDRPVGGIMIFAKTSKAASRLSNQVREKIFKKEYLAVCNGIFDKKFGTISLPIARKENSIIERCISENGQPAITHYEVLKEFDNYSLVKCSLETGRTHQIRVHMSAIGHPLLGDSLYGSISDLINRQALHCFNLQFIHPVYNNDLNFWGDLPNDFKIFDIK